jgi:uncharacterized protein YceH (UPF0502 family)
MITLTADECRVLGVLVEKAQTTPAQYPMSLNSIIVGCSQKSNRNPVVEFDEDRAVAALDGLREKHLVVFAESISSRVMKYRHCAAPTLGVEASGLVVLVEMLLRGPQTVGELRGRASRMFPLESLEVVRAVLQHLMDRPEPLVKCVPGGRADRYAQLLCPDLHPLEESPAGAEPAGPPPEGLADRVAKLEEELTRLRAAIERLANSLGVTDILGP